MEPLGALETHSGEVEAFSRIMEAHLDAMQPFFMDMEPWRKLNSIVISI
jgi:hypothetical protein